MGSVLHLHHMCRGLIRRLLQWRRKQKNRSNKRLLSQIDNFSGLGGEKGVQSARFVNRKGRRSLFVTEDSSSARLQCDKMAQLRLWIQRGGGPIYVSAKRTQFICFGKHHLSSRTIMSCAIKNAGKKLGSFSKTNPIRGVFLLLLTQIADSESVKLRGHQWLC